MTEFFFWKLKWGQRDSNRILSAFFALHGPGSISVLFMVPQAMSGSLLGFGRKLGISPAH